ncbi:MAG: Cache 3/Cache 2 fusion domain-containing protein [Treponema sp.]|nr:Cache 3/Cache 2 fusion domain-containing protein [Treponema sp.]
MIAVSNAILALVSYSLSKKELKKQVDQNMLNTVQITAEQINRIIVEEQKMLNSVSRMPYVFECDFYDKEELKLRWNDINAITKNDSHYLGMAIYNMDGIGWTTTGKWQDLHEREYLSKALNGEVNVTDPEFSKVNGHISTFYAQPIKNASGKQVGVVVSVVDSMELCNSVSNMTIGLESHPVVFNKKTGNFVASSDIEMVKNSFNIKTDSEAEFLKVVDMMQNSDRGTTSFRNYKNKDYLVAFTSIPNSDWTVACAAPSSDFYSGLLRFLNVLVSVFICTTIIAVVICGFLITGLLRPLKKVDENIHSIATGNADLTKRIKIKSEDEVGSVVKGFNMFTEKLQSIVSEIKNSKSVLEQVGDVLIDTIDKTKDSILMMNKNISNVQQQLSLQNNDVNSTVSAVNDISSGLDSLESMIENQVSSVTEASSSVEEMLGNISSVTNTVEKMAKSFSELLIDLHAGTTKQHDVTERITQIAEQSQMLEEANAVIASIAEQTNLLAMNAAIEAAHAGEAGKGFSVVADEIRKLSETSSEQSFNIGEQLNAIKTSIENVLAASQASDLAFQSVGQKIDGTNTLVQQISNAMQEQEEGSKQINLALNSMNDSTRQVKDSSSRMQEVNKKIMSQAERLQNAAMVMEDAVGEMASKVVDMNGSSTDLNDISGKIGVSIDEISNQIDLFKV